MYDPSPIGYSTAVLAAAGVRLAFVSGHRAGRALLALECALIAGQLQAADLPSPGEDLRVPGIALGAASCACGRLLWRALADAGSTTWHLARHRGKILRGGAYVPRATPPHDAPRRRAVGRPGCPRPGASGTPPRYPAEHRPDAHPPVRPAQQPASDGAGPSGGQAERSLFSRHCMELAAGFRIRCYLRLPPGHGTGSEPFFRDFKCVREVLGSGDPVFHDIEGFQQDRTPCFCRDFGP